VGGRRYYIEALHKEAFGGDNLAVGWQLPNGTMERPIPGDRLIKFERINVPPQVQITSPADGQTFTAPATISFNVNASDANGGLLTVDFYNGTARIARDASSPYSFTWTNVAAGTYTIEARAWDQDGGTASDFVTFNVIGNCEGTGTIVREIWTGLPGTSVSAIPVNSAPNRTVTLTSLSTPNYYGNDYGSRIRGYICVPATGAYTFWISGDDNSELWLSTNDNPVNKTRIAYVTGATRVNQWDKYSTQQSALVNLVQGQRYYIEVLHKEANGADHVEVGWQLPSGTLERPIAGNRLIPFDDPSTSAAMFAGNEVNTFGEEGKVSISPNPVASGNRVFIALPGATDQEVLVDIKSITGGSVQRETLSSNGEGVIIDLKPSIAAGMYLIMVSNNKKRWATKLQVK
jgi:hypothetical protein